MNTSNINLFEKCLYNPITNVLIFKPLAIWADANYQLEKKYQEPEVYLGKNNDDVIEVKNTARHITGMGLAASQYGIGAYTIGFIKEGYDLAKNFFKEPLFKVSRSVLEDSKIDLKHNHIGIQYILNNPDISCDELMDFAINFAKEEQNQETMLEEYLSIN